MSTPKIYIPGDPRSTEFVQQLYLISGLIQATTHYYVTAEHWGQIYAELNAQYRGQLMDPTRPAPWDANPNGPLRIGIEDPYLMVHNAGTDDEGVIYLLNEAQPQVEAFGKKRDALRIA